MAAMGAMGGGGGQFTSLPGGFGGVTGMRSRSPPIPGHAVVPVRAVMRERCRGASFGQKIGEYPGSREYFVHYDPPFSPRNPDTPEKIRPDRTGNRIWCEGGQ